MALVFALCIALFLAAAAAVALAALYIYSRYMIVLTVMCALIEGKGNVDTYRRVFSEVRGRKIYRVLIALGLF